MGAVISTLLYLCTLTLGHFPHLTQWGPGLHLVMGLVTSMTVVLMHCLVFAIFTGSGKDTRLLVGDLQLDPEYVKKTKRFKREVFPPALYAIFWILCVLAMGGALSVGVSPWVRWIHLALAWGVFLYNVRVFRIEYRAICENASILKELNERAGKIAAEQFVPKTTDTQLEILDQTIDDYEWGTHVYALGKFLVFLGFNVWLPYIYLRYIVGYFTMPLWPFLTLSLALLGFGYYLRLQYQDYQPTRSPA